MQSAETRVSNAAVLNARGELLSGLRFQSRRVKCTGFPLHSMLRLSGLLNKLTNHYFINITLFKEVLDYIASYHVLTPSDVI